MCRVALEPGAISQEEQCTWLQDCKVLEVPTLFDIAALYEESNAELVRQFMQQVDLLNVSQGMPGGEADVSRSQLTLLSTCDVMSQMALLLIRFQLKTQRTIDSSARCFSAPNDLQ